MIPRKKHKILTREIYRYGPETLEYLEYSKRVRRVEKFAPIFNERLRKGTVVDLGCGFGIYMKELKRRTVVGIDFSSEGLMIAKKYCPSCLLVLGDLEYLPFKKESIDSFFSFTSIYCLLPEVQNKLFRELYRALKKNGNILLVEANAWNPFKDRLWLRHPLNKNRVEKQLKEIGFRHVDIKFSNFVPRFVLKQGGVIFNIFSAAEKFLEFLQIPLSGSLLIYAEKPP